MFYIIIAVKIEPAITTEPDVCLANRGNHGNCVSEKMCNTRTRCALRRLQLGGGVSEVSKGPRCSIKSLKTVVRAQRATIDFQVHVFTRTLNVSAGVPQ